MRIEIKILLVCVVIGLGTYLLNDIFNDVIQKVNTQESQYKKHIGEKFVIDKDTLTIIDYSILNENFTLSDGRKVNYSLIHKD